MSFEDLVKKLEALKNILWDFGYWGDMIESAIETHKKEANREGLIEELTEIKKEGEAFFEELEKIFN